MTSLWAHNSLPQFFLATLSLLPLALKGCKRDQNRDTQWYYIRGEARASWAGWSQVHGLRGFVRVFLLDFQTKMGASTSLSELREEEIIDIEEETKCKFFPYPPLPSPSFLTAHSVF